MAATMCARVFDAANLHFKEQSIRSQFEKFWPELEINLIRIDHDPEVDYCGSVLASSTLELISYYKRGEETNIITMSKSTRSEIELKLHSAKSRREPNARPYYACPRNMRKCPRCLENLSRVGYVNNVKYYNPPS